jgi:methylglutaconyl-CoA hydratase
MLEQIKTEKVWTFRLNRPEVKNAFHPELIEALTQAFLSVSKVQSVRVVILEGAGSVFCAGADLNWMQSLKDADFQKNQQDAERLHTLFKTIWECPLPVVCKVHGAAFGGALGLMACSDYVVVDENVQMSFSEVKLGIAPSVISEFVLKKNLSSLISTWMMSGILFSANEAFHAGLAHKVCVNSELDSSVERFVESICNAGPEAVRATKKLVRDLEVTDPQNVRALTTGLIARLRVSAEGQEGLKSFLEKRKPSWMQK